LTTKKTITNADGNPGPGLGQARKYGGVKPLNGIPTVHLLMINLQWQYKYC